jgi:hypothetical protein
MQIFSQQSMLLVLAPCCLAFLVLPGCEEGPADGSSMAGGSQQATSARMKNDSLDADLSDAEWGEIDVTPRRGDSSARGGMASSPSGGSGAGTPTEESRPWTIVIATIAGERATQPQLAREALQQIRELSPELASARMISTRSGVIIGYGAYADVRDPQAQKDLERIKAITVRGAKPFATAAISRTPTDSLAKVKLHQHDLRTARLIYPNVDPLYTLQVGVWSDFDSGQMSPAQVRSNAEKQAAELRVKGHDAYFYHDDDKVISIVTVGLFDKSALAMDKQLNTPVLSEEVGMLLRKFPAHLVNGTTMEEPISRNKPSMGTRVQTCKLVLVP